MSAESSQAYRTGAWSEWEGYVVNGTFPLRQLLGVSNRGVVFLTSHSWSNSPAADAAIKLVAADSLHAEELLSQWRSIAALSHPHLVRVLDIGRCQLGEHPFVYVVMEYAEQTLAEVLVHRALNADEVQDLLPPTLDALGFLHRNFLVHGQVKPANILVVNDQVKLASDTVRAIGQLGSGAVRASVYDPPELTDGRIGAPGDIWGLGVTLVEALTQRAPVWAGERSATPSLPAELPQAFADTVRRCLRFDRIDRPTVIELEARYNPGASARSAATDRRGAASTDRPAGIPAVAEPTAAPPTQTRATTAAASPTGAGAVEPTATAATQSRATTAGAPSARSAAERPAAPATHARATTATEATVAPSTHSQATATTPSSTGAGTAEPTTAAATQARTATASAPSAKTSRDPTAAASTHSQATAAAPSSTGAGTAEPAAAAATQARTATASAPSAKTSREPTAAPLTHSQATAAGALSTGAGTAEPAAAAATQARTATASAPSAKTSREPAAAVPTHSQTTAATPSSTGAGTAEPAAAAATQARTAIASAPSPTTARESTAAPPTHSQATAATPSSIGADTAGPTPAAPTQSPAASASAPYARNAAEPTAVSATHPHTTTVAAPSAGTITAAPTAAASTPAASTRPGSANSGTSHGRSAAEGTTASPADAHSVAATSQHVTNAAEPTLSAPAEPRAVKAAARKAAAKTHSPRSSSVPMVIGAVLIALAVWVGLRLSQLPSASETAGSDPAHIALGLASAPDASGPEVAAVSGPASGENPSTPAAPTSSQVASAPTSPPTATADAVLHEVIPEVPQRVRDKIHGQISVSVRVLVDPAGNVVGQFLEKAGRSGYFASLARDAASDWKFAPADSRDARVWLLQFDFTHDGATAQAAPAR